MLFQARFKEGIRAGKVTLTFRTWKEAKVTVGGAYRLGPDDAVVVDAIDRVSIADVTAAAARKAGFADLDELRSMLARATFFPSKGPRQQGAARQAFQATSLSTRASSNRRRRCVSGIE